MQIYDRRGKRQRCLIKKKCFPASFSKFSGTILKKGSKKMRISKKQEGLFEKIIFSQQITLCKTIYKKRFVLQVIFQ